MANPKLNRPTQVVERNLALTGQVMQYLFQQPQLFEALPKDFELVILPIDDSEMRLYNLDLLDRHQQEGKPVVFARFESNTKNFTEQGRLNLYTPVAV